MLLLDPCQIKIYYKDIWITSTVHTHISRNNLATFEKLQADLAKLSK